LINKLINQSINQSVNPQINNHVLYSRTCLLYKPMAKTAGKGRIPTRLRKRLTYFHETWNFELIPEGHPSRKISFRRSNVGGLEKYPVKVSLRHQIKSKSKFICPENIKYRYSEQW